MVLFAILLWRAAIHTFEGVAERTCLVETAETCHLQYGHFWVFGEQCRGTVHLYCGDICLWRLSRSTLQSAAECLHTHVHL